jgi:hypothetical protein
MSLAEAEGWITKPDSFQLLSRGGRKYKGGNQKDEGWDLDALVDLRQCVLRHDTLLFRLRSPRNQLQLVLGVLADFRARKFGGDMFRVFPRLRSLLCVRRAKPS